MRKYKLKRDISDIENNYRLLRDCLIIEMEITVTVASLEKNTINDSVWYIEKDGQSYPKKFIDMFYEEI